MAYPGNTELSNEAQERVVTAFRQVVAKLQDGRREEALIGLEFVLRLDPTFAPALNLSQQLGSGAAEIDLSGIIAQLDAPTTEEIDGLLVEAVDDFNNRAFADAKSKVELVLKDLPGHKEARQLLSQIEESLKGESQVSQFLNQAQEALAAGDPQEAANFVMMAQALDPHNPGIQPALEQINKSAGQPVAAPPPQAAPPPARPSVDQRGETGQADFAFADEPDEQESEFGFETMSVATADELGFSGPAEEGPPAASPAATDQEASSAFAPAEADEQSFDFTEQSDGDMFSPAAEGDEAFDFSPVAEEGGSAVAPQEDQWETPSAEDFDFGAGDSDGFAPDFSQDEDLFSGEGGPAEVGASAAPEEAQRIQELIEQGEAAFDRNDYDEAITCWSQIYLIDPSHQEAARLIEEARLAKDSNEQQLEELLGQAQAAADAGDADRAQDLVEEILTAKPNHVGANLLRDKLTGEPEPKPTPDVLADVEGELPGFEEDLFEDLPTDEAQPETLPEPELEAPGPAPKKTGKKAPLVPILAGVLGLVVVLVGAWFGKQLLLSGSSGGESQEQAEAFNRLLERADQLAQRNRIEEAIAMLEAYPASELEKGVIAKRLDRYQGQLHPTPTPIPEDLISAEKYLDQRLYLRAYETAQAGLAKNSRDLGLQELKEQIKRQVPLVVNLHEARKANNSTVIISLTTELLEKFPHHPEFTAELERALFNSALEELRSYNLTGAEVHLTALLKRQPDDAEAKRILDFIKTYKTRPVDMRLKVFIGNLSPR